MADDSICQKTLKTLTQNCARIYCRHRKLSFSFRGLR
jgi:hypothetical protein